MKLNEYTLIGYHRGEGLSDDPIKVIVLATDAGDAIRRAKGVWNVEYIVKKIDTTYDSSSIIIDDLTKDEARNRIIRYFELHSPNKVYPSDILEYLKIDFRLGMEIIEELEKEGKIKIE